MSSDRQEKVALVAGAATDTGRTIVARLSDGSHAVIAVDDPASDVEEHARGLARAGRRVVARPATVATPEEAARCVSGAAATFDGLDLLVVCGPRCEERSLRRLEGQTWRSAVDGPLAGAFSLCQAASRLMLDAGAGGRCICVGFGPGLSGAGFGQAHVAAAGGGLTGIVRAVSAELLHKRVAINGVLTQGDATDAAAVVEFLASDAAEGITGQIVLADARRLSLLQVGQTAGAVTARGGWSEGEIAERWDEIAR